MFASARSTTKLALDHNELWAYLHRIYKAKRGSHDDAFEGATPKTTYEDIQQIVKCWDDKVWLTFLHHPSGYQGDLTALADWNQHRDRIQRDIAHTLHPKVVYPVNEWFWHTATKDLAESLNRVNPPARKTSSKDDIARANLQAFGSVLGYGLRAYLDRKVSNKHDKS